MLGDKSPHKPYPTAGAKVGVTYWERGGGGVPHWAGYDWWLRRFMVACTCEVSKLGFVGDGSLQKHAYRLGFGGNNEGGLNLFPPTFSKLRLAFLIQMHEH